ncbi:MAG: Crp/Fnr family transcriptional regulator [Pseudomonadota bacterium]
MPSYATPSVLPDSSAAPAVCAACAVRNSSLCGVLSDGEIGDLNAIAHRKRLQPGQFHVLEGDRSVEFANVTSGVAKLVRGSGDGRTQIVGLLFPSDFIGGALGTSAHRQEPHSIEAASPLELCLFPRDGFQRLMRRYPALEHKLLERTLTDLEVAREWMVLLGRKTAQERVATFLLYVADRMARHGCHAGLGFDLPLGRSDIADHIGLTLETVSRQITKLRSDGILEMHGARHVLAVDRDRLAERAGF